MTAPAPRAAPSAAQVTPTVKPFGLGAPWLRHANLQELQRLARLQMRIKRKEIGLRALVSERRKIMARCIRRMRRANGVE